MGGSFGSFHQAERMVIFRTMNVRGTRLLGLVVLWLAVFGSWFESTGAVPAYTFTDFEIESGWREGPLPMEKSPVQLVQGAAAVISLPEHNPEQILELQAANPFTAMFVDTLPLAKVRVVFCELLTRPASVEEQADAEFLDFGGAILGLFRVGDGGELRVLSSRSADESVWISTGLRFPLDGGGRAKDWLRITVRLDRKTERWDLRVNGRPVLKGLGAVPGKSGGLAMWLYGQKTQPCQFDDLLLAAVEPDQLEKMLAARQRRARHQIVTAKEPSGPQIVMRSKPTVELRSTQQAISRAEHQLVAPVLRDWKLALQIGGQTYESGPPIDADGREPSITVYSPQYDDSGNPLPGSLTITADAELKPGTDLSRLRWIVAELKGWPDQLGEVLQAGDFATGLVQTVTIPGEWTKKGSYVNVWARPGGLDALWWRYKMRQ
jgi:hypothetical protein